MKPKRDPCSRPPVTLWKRMFPSSKALQCLVEDFSGSVLRCGLRVQLQGLHRGKPRKLLFLRTESLSACRKRPQRLTRSSMDTGCLLLPWDSVQSSRSRLFVHYVRDMEHHRGARLADRRVRPLCSRHGTGLFLVKIQWKHRAPASSKLRSTRRSVINADRPFLLPLPVTAIPRLGSSAFGNMDGIG